MRLAATGLAAVLLATASAAQVDPFDAARSHIGARQNAEALAIIDSGQFDVSHQTGEGFSLLHYAASAGNLEMVRALIARGADPGLKSVSGTTPYQMAIGTLVQAEIRRADCGSGRAGRAGLLRRPPDGPAAASGRKIDGRALRHRPRRSSEQQPLAGGTALPPGPGRHLVQPSGSARRPGRGLCRGQSAGCLWLDPAAPRRRPGTRRPGQTPA